MPLIGLQDRSVFYLSYRSGGMYDGSDGIACMKVEDFDGLRGRIEVCIEEKLQALEVHKKNLKELLSNMS